MVRKTNWSEFPSTYMYRSLLNWFLDSWRFDVRTFKCSYLNGEVELSDERESHIADNHPDLLPEYLAQVGLTLADPDQVHRSLCMSAARIFCRQFEEVRQGKYVVVVGVSESAPVMRHWIITAYITRRLANGEIEWRKN